MVRKVRTTRSPRTTKLKPTAKKEKRKKRLASKLVLFPSGCILCLVVTFQVHVDSPLEKAETLLGKVLKDINTCRFLANRIQ